MRDVGHTRESTFAALAKGDDVVFHDETTSAALLVIADDGTILSLDRRFGSMWGMPDDVVASSSLDVVARWLEERDDGATVAVAKLLREHERAAGGGELVTPEQVIDWSRAPIVRGGDRGHALVWSFRDTTRYHAATRALRDAENWLRMFAAHNEGAVLELDGDARVVGLWATHAELFATPEAELRGRTLVEILGEEHGALFESRVRAVLATGRPMRFEHALEIRGVRRVITVNAVLITEFEVEAPCVTLLIHDITEHARMRLQLQQAERLASIGRLAAGVAHEVNNPLTYMLINLQRIQRGLRELARPPQGPVVVSDTLRELGQSVDMTLEGTRRVQEIVHDLMRFSRGEHNESRFPVDIHRVLTFTLDLASSELRGRARVVCELGPVPQVLATEVRLGQVMLNLLLNAAQAIPEGDPDRHEIRVVTRTDEHGSAVIEVHDTGTGIPEAVLEQIFEPFFTTKSQGTGTGLGLAICHGITTALGGRIWVESAAGRGSIFRVVLPGVSGVARET